MMTSYKAILASVLTAMTVAQGAAAESHTVRFTNRCGRGTPTLKSQQGAVLSTGGDFTSNGPLIGAIAYLQTGGCGANGDQCTLVETTLKNPTTPGSGSSSDISLIPPLKFSVTSGFKYFNGCDGQGTTCDGPNCNTAFHKPDDTHVQVACQTNNVGLNIIFC